jgi:hypothetical protein
MKKMMTLLQGFFRDRNMYLGIFAEIAFVVVLSLIGFIICLALQR